MKNKPVLITIIIVSLLALGFFLLKGYAASKKATAIRPSIETVNGISSAPMSVVPADKIEVVNFFGTQRCVSCLTIGRISKKTIEEKFANEVKSGKIAFKEINVEYPENNEIVTKYQARGSSLFINTIRGEKDNIEEDVTVWRLVKNEAQFVTYLEGKLNGLLGK